MRNAVDGAGQGRSSFLPIRAQLTRGQCLRPPWSTEARIRKNCTSCGDCIRVCPEAILIAGPAGTPAVDFKNGACTFCGKCAEACSESVFQDSDAEPWAMMATVSSTCLLKAGISCQSCTDACDEMALRFDMRAGLVGEIDVMQEKCTGCGACVATCPVQAIQVKPLAAGAS